MITLGLSKFIQAPLSRFKGGKLGLITNATGVDESLNDNISLLADHPDFKLVTIFSPEHGLLGAEAPGKEIDATVEPRTGLPVYSLYGKTRKPTAEMLTEVEALVFDIQDIGVRYYTYISTLLLSMQAASEAGIPFVVLDRPNPINGISIDGNRLKPEFHSFVGCHPIAIRHGMTVGELASLFKSDLSLEIDLEVVKMDGWNRTMWYDDTKLPWVIPSPNMPTWQTAIIYSGTCLLEGTNLSVGRGTTIPFQIIGAPWISSSGAYDLAEELNSLKLESVKFRAISFIPSTSKYGNEVCFGVQAHMLDKFKFQPVFTGLKLIETLIKLYLGDFQWRKSGDKYHFDLLMGDQSVRVRLSAGDSAEAIVDSWKGDVEEFELKRRECLIYGE
jgi:uncharacterized protein YbbC (DUF1343 family)